MLFILDIICKWGMWTKEIQMECLFIGTKKLVSVNTHKIPIRISLLTHVNKYQHVSEKEGKKQVQV